MAKDKGRRVTTQAGSMSKRITKHTTEVATEAAGHSQQREHSETERAVRVHIEPKLPLTPAEEQLAQALAHIARRAHLRIIRRDAQRNEAI